MATSLLHFVPRGSRWAPPNCTTMSHGSTFGASLMTKECFGCGTKKRDRAFRTSPKHVAAGSNFYRLWDFAELGRDPLTMEKQFADLEGEVSRITDQWLYWLGEAKRSERIEIPKVNREIVSLYIALQFCRTADARDIILAFDSLPSDPGLTEEENEIGRWGTYLWGQWIVDELMKQGKQQNAQANSRRHLSDRA